MILVAATAVGFGLSHSLRGNREFALELSCLSAWTLAAFAVRVRQPRPALRVLLRQPGALATAVVLLLAPLAVAFGLLARAIKAVMVHFGYRTAVLTSGDLPISLGAALAGAVVAGAWLGLALSGRRRPEPGWIDALGRALGTLWVIHAGVAVVLLLFLCL
jgi:hypothetical protein